MTEVKLRDSRSDQQRIADRLKPSSSPDAADVHVAHGTGPTRTVTTVHRSGHQSQHGAINRGRGDITGGKR